MGALPKLVITVDSKLGENESPFAVPLRQMRPSCSLEALGTTVGKWYPQLLFGSLCEGRDPLFSGEADARLGELADAEL